MPRQLRLAPCVALCLLLGGTIAGHAVVNVNITKSMFTPPDPTTSTIGSYFTPSASDLANAGQPSLAAMAFAATPASGAALNNGSIGIDGRYTSPTYNATLGGYMGLGNNTVTFTFASPYGCNIYTIDAYNGDNEHPSAGRQVYNLYYSPVGDAAFYPLIEESFAVNTNGTPSNYGDDILHPTATFAYYSRTTLTSLAGPGVPLVAFADALRFVLAPSAILDDLGRAYYGNANLYWREIDVIGLEMPEPGMLTCLAAGGLWLAGRRRRG